MNRKLKNMLKGTYGVQPERKNAFIEQLRHDPVWRRLHPISSLIKLPSSSVVIPAVITAAVLGAGIIAYVFVNGGSDKTISDTAQPIIEMTEPESPQTIPTATAVSSVSASRTKVQVKNTVRTTVTRQASQNAYQYTEPFKADTTAKSNTHTTIAVYEKPSVTTAVTSVYNTHLFDHVQNIDDLRLHYDDIKNTQNMYGYPDYNYFEDMLRLLFEESGMNYDEIIKGMEDYLVSDLSYGVLDSVFSMKNPPVIEGRTVGIDYTAYDGKPWTVCEVVISEVYNSDSKHEFKSGDRVKIAMPGGYMPAGEYLKLNPESKLFSGWTDKEISSAVIYEDGSNQRPPEIGDVFTYIISYDDFIPDFPVQGCLTRFSLNDMAQFTRNGNVFTSCNSNFKDMYFTLEQLNKNKFEFSDVINDPESGRSIGIKDNSFLLRGEFDCYSVSPDGKAEFLGTCSTENGFYPFDDENNYTVTWNDNEVIIEYKCSYLRDDFKTVRFGLPKK